MKFTNMNPISSSPQINIIQNGFVWDLHNVADFIGHEIDSNNNSLKLTWDYGCDCDGINNGNVHLIFLGINKIIITEKDAEVPRSEDSCLDNIHLKNENEIVVSFRSGQSFEIQCDEVEFDPMETSGHKA